VTTHRISEGDADRALTVSVGDDLVVELPQTGGTGFVWSVEAEPAVLSVASDTLRRRSALPGATGDRVLLLRAAGPGTTTLTLALGRPWPGGETERRVTLQVTVTE
jgi:predicted secreted protein